MKSTFCFLLLLPLLVAAQINESDTLRLKANLSLTGLYQAGNVETVIFRAKSDFSFTPFKKWVFKTTNSYVYQEFGKEKADEDILSLNFLYFNPERRFYPQILTFFSSNFRREIDVRYIMGAGVTYQVFNKEDNWLKMSLSSEYEQTTFDRASFNISQYNGCDAIDTWRGTFWINGKHTLFKKKVIFNHVWYYQPSLEQSNNYRWQADLSLEFPIWKFLNFKVNYLHTFESIVIENQKEEDQFLTFGFTIKSY